MNLWQVIRAIEQTAAKQPPVNTVVRNDIFRLNASPVVKYSTFAWLQGEHRVLEDSDLIEWSFTLFYVDRLTENRGNEIEIQSTGIELLENVLRGLEEAGIFAGDHTFQTFNQRFADECAGVFCRVTLETPRDGICEQWWQAMDALGDFNLDYNTDFHCWTWQDGDRTIYFI